MNDTWQAGARRGAGFPSSWNAAVEGKPQFVRRRDGREVVVVSKEYYEQTKPSLKSVLLSHRFGERGDEFDQAIDTARSVIGANLTPRGPEDLT